MRERNRLQIIADNLETKIFFNQEISRLHKLNATNPNTEDLYKLRQVLSKKYSELPALSDFWDNFLAIKVMYPKLKISVIIEKFNTKGASLLTIVNKKTGETHYAIEVFPEETVKDDVVYTFGKINERYGSKTAVQPTTHNIKLDKQWDRLRRKNISNRAISKSYEHYFSGSDTDVSIRVSRLRKKKQ
jgi:hypothetical protein